MWALLIQQLGPQILAWATPIVLAQVKRFYEQHNRLPSQEELDTNLHAEVQKDRDKIAAALAEPE